MSKLVFDFNAFWPREKMCEDEQRAVANTAQILFDKWLSEQTIVYRAAPLSGWYYENQLSANEKKLLFRSARLVCIEEINECKHPFEKIKPTMASGNLFADKWAIEYNWECECGAKVKPTRFDSI